MKLKFKEINQTTLNCGWCMGAGVVVGAAAAYGAGVIILT